MALLKLSNLLNKRAKQLLCKEVRDSKDIAEIVQLFLNERSVKTDISIKNIKYTGNTLTLTLGSSVLKYQLYALEEELLDRLNKTFPFREPFSKIRFR
ncbi:MAG: hypothetical protein A3C80_04135 [Candidatus Ryanbacteria bacterium RIFCSPHIGHO2_02_FULL_45_43]|uniref:Uncharacterized protein n=1 Tax=Candidatus Ryanbacteria bacterium RIFCSPHIGHO2_01_45_13 TaxID=1802112 RepID=A0A1G2FZP4_9BACT|nr:MAG: hypothetical protein A2718_00165 [Candidatus Ryanbacteria bacterium RIFCSPHIGHO2_01_FULL_44_130]OGZ43317.1 MAG: hypothetical protein A2W41_01190 [Candidatus Ryanbacteria bacterium RIFCSPHIGHO2_01_45_13]OGZ48225.1 MAG: hypothetical protein A3C80_04135 [Candidatus Ryanbacteria bacterium RIFCSPHIGHO2_02_FULL_45_43]OGZ50001.1 MAG: hypothetical protein A3E55_01795 [Candidatus Ryanbacteria bacterium RIFCSPHIGHO2_12_FULL_44_20]OGZ51460.1 MAG: hypothetical protein A3A17_01745 [Candidatus Ryanba